MKHFTNRKKGTPVKAVRVSKYDKGFSLVELLIVIGIMAVLVAVIGLPIFAM
ncbi:MAG: prepilin-type N-terminal cleavage/methylation domain-containing protein [Lachnospiraceae bacterium]|nr:prepilin-type N-terminal cleavage/methylation domain-containing protein [Lachnospiraceae bacterium]